METSYISIPLSNTTAMKQLIFIVLLLCGINNVISQTRITDPENNIVWVNGIPTCPDDAEITALINKVGIDNLQKSKRGITRNEADICRKLGKAFKQRDMYEGADWYLERVKAHVEIVKLEPEVVFEEEVPADIAASLQSDKEFLQSIPKSFENVSPTDMKKLAQEIEGQLAKLIKEKEALIKSHASPEVIKAKDESIKSLGKEKKIIDLTVKEEEMKIEAVKLKDNARKLNNYLIGAGITILLLALGIMVLFQRKTIKVQDKEIEKQLNDINTKNTYLEHAARIIRHDMHSGINTYIPRGISSLEKRLTGDTIKDLKIEGPLKMIREGLNHTQRVYKSVYEFTNLVKRTVDFETEEQDVTKLLNGYFEKTSYAKQLEISELGIMSVNSILFCNAIDNLVKNGLKYNNSENKSVSIFIEDNHIIVQDNGIGMNNNEFKKHLKSVSKADNDEIGLGLNISFAILKEHGFDMECEKNDVGTKIKIKVK